MQLDCPLDEAEDRTDQTDRSSMSSAPQGTKHLKVEPDAVRTDKLSPKSSQVARHDAPASIGMHPQLAFNDSISSM
jgi:hypothetical protein